MGGGMMGGSGGGSFLGTAAAAAAGVVGGSLLLNSFRGMMGGSHQGFGDTSLADRATGSSPWSDQSNSNLARDAGVNDIGSKNLAAQDRAQISLRIERMTICARRRTRRHGSGRERRFRQHDDSDFA